MSRYKKCSSGMFDFYANIFSYPFKVHAEEKRKQAAIEAQKKTQERENEIHMAVMESMYNGIKEMFRTASGDLILTEVIRTPDLTGIFYIMTGDDEDLQGPYKRKIQFDRSVRKWYFKMDGEKWYFRKTHKEFNSRVDYAEL